MNWFHTLPADFFYFPLIGVFFIFLFLSFYFSGIEAGFLSLSREKFLVDLRKGNPKVARIEILAKNTAIVLTVALLGNNLSNIGLVIVSSRLWNHWIGVEWEALYIFFSTITLLMIGEVIPKIVFRKLSPTVFYEVAYLLVIFYRIFSPVIYWMTQFTDPIVNKVFNVSDDGLTRKDLSDIMTDGREQGVVEEKEKRFIENFSNLSTTRAGEIMTPLVDVFMVSKSQDLKNIFDQTKEIDLDMIPVFDQRIDHIIGFCSLTEAYFSNKRKMVAKNFLKKCSYVPKSITLEKILNKFEFLTTTPLVVIDEHGGCCGIINFKNFLDNLFGFSYDPQMEHKESLIHEIDQGVYRIDPSFDIDNFNRMFQEKIVKDGFETLGGFLTHLEGRVPKAKSMIHYQHLTFKIIRTSKTSLEEIEFSTHPSK